MLSDTERRKRFDETGRTDEPSVDRDRQQAMEVLVDRFVRFVTDFMQKGPSSDPRMAPIVLIMKKEFASEIAQLKASRKTGERHRRDHGAKGPDTVAALFGQQIEHIQAQLNQLDDALRVRQLAVEILKDYDFDAMPPAMATVSMTTATM